MDYWCERRVPNAECELCYLILKTRGRRVAYFMTQLKKTWQSWMVYTKHCGQKNEPHRLSDSRAGWMLNLYGTNGIKNQYIIKLWIERMRIYRHVLWCWNTCHFCLWGTYYVGIDCFTCIYLFFFLLKRFFLMFCSKYVQAEQQKINIL